MNSSNTARKLALGAIFTAAVMSTGGCTHIARQLYMGVPAETAQLDSQQLQQSYKQQHKMPGAKN